MALHYLETGSTDPAFNLAFEEFVLENRREGDWLMLWQNANSVIVGLNQNAAEEVDPAYEEVSMTLGAKPFQAFRKVLFPIIKSAVIAGGILAFTRSLGETGATTSISDTVNTVPIYITHLVEDGLYTEAAMCSIVLIALCFILMFGIRVITGRRARRDA